MNRKYSIQFVQGSPQYVYEFEASEFEQKDGFITFFLGKIPVATYLASQILGISSKPVE